ncbi:MAG: hypothetical protein Q9162_006035 [Coniocarpon cinnabarinum]
MAAQSDYQFSANSIEHTFRAFKKEAQKLNRDKPVAGMVVESRGAKSKKRKAGNGEGDDGEGDDEGNERAGKRRGGFDKAQFVEDCVNAGEEDDEETVI